MDSEMRLLQVRLYGTDYNNKTIENKLHNNKSISTKEDNI